MVVTAHGSGRLMDEIGLTYHVLIFSSKTIRLHIMRCASVIRELSAIIFLIITLDETVNLDLVIGADNDRVIIEMPYLSLGISMDNLRRSCR